MSTNIPFTTFIQLGTIYLLPNYRYVGLNTREWMIESGVRADRVVELDWWQEVVAIESDALIFY